MPVKFGSILHLNNSASEATMDANNLRGTTFLIDSFDSASLATIGSGLPSAPGKRRLGVIVSTTGSITDPVKYYVYNQTSSGDSNLSGSEWTNTSNWSEINLGASSADDLDWYIDVGNGRLTSSLDILVQGDGVFTGYVSASGNVYGDRITIDTSVDLRNQADNLYIVADGITGASTVTSLSFPVGAGNNFTLLDDPMLNLSVGAGATNVNIGASTSTTTIADDLNVLGDAQFVNITASQNAIVTGYVSASEFRGDLIGTAATASYVLASNIDQPFTNITSSGDISASGLLYISMSEDTAGDYNPVVVYDVDTGRLYYTGSYGSGNGVTFPYSGSDDLYGTPAQAMITGSLYLSGSGHITASGNVDIFGDLNVQGNFSIPGYNNVQNTLDGLVAGGDNLGTHTASKDLNMDGYNIYSSSVFIFDANDPEPTAVAGGMFYSASNDFYLGFA